MQIKKVVYKNRIRLKEFLVDFDKVCLTPDIKGRTSEQAKLLTSTMSLASQCCLQHTVEKRLHLRKSVPVRLEHGRTGQAADSSTVASVSVLLATIASC